MSRTDFRLHGPRTLLSVTTRYALLALMALPEDGSYWMAKGLAAHLAIPLPYLAKILKRLREAGILESLKGPTGGYRLARPSGGISLHEVIVTIEGRPGLDLCPFGQRICHDTAPCPLCTLWGAAFREWSICLAKVSVRDLSVQKSGS